MFAFDVVMFLIMDPNVKTTMPASPELWTNSSMSCRRAVQIVPIFKIFLTCKNSCKDVGEKKPTFGKGFAGRQWIPPTNLKFGRNGRGNSKSQYVRINQISALPINWQPLVGVPVTHRTPKVRLKLEKSKTTFIKPRRGSSGGVLVLTSDLRVIFINPGPVNRF